MRHFFVIKINKEEDQCFFSRILDKEYKASLCSLLVKGLLQDFEKMKVTNSLKTLKNRDRNCRIIRRKGRVYVINKKNPRFKARQG